jgi:hypothetical protein
VSDLIDPEPCLVISLGSTQEASVEDDEEEVESSLLSCFVEDSISGERPSLDGSDGSRRPRSPSPDDTRPSSVGVVELGGWSMGGYLHSLNMRKKEKNDTEK